MAILLKRDIYGIILILYNYFKYAVMFRSELFRIAEMIRDEKMKHDFYSHECLSKFEPEKYFIREFSHWLIVLRKKQITLGSCVFLIKSLCPNMSDVTEEELAELKGVFTWYENLTQRLFAPDKYNYVVAMMKDPFVHIHAIPRYSRIISRYDAEWSDPCWPYFIQFMNVETDKTVLENILFSFMKEETSV